MLEINPKIKSLVDKLWARFWAGGISNPLTAIEQITYLLFIRQIDNLDRIEEEQSRARNHRFVSRFSGIYVAPETHDEVPKSALRWSAFKDMPPATLLIHFQNNVFPFYKSLNGSDSLFARHMKGAVCVIPTGALLASAIALIEEIFEEIQIDSHKNKHAFQDIQGDVYELLLSEISSSGKNGQFRTPRHIVKLVVELVGPELGQTICDPACGTGGFLLDAYHYILTKAAKSKPASHRSIQEDDDGFLRIGRLSTLNNRDRVRLEGGLIGYDFDATMVRLGLMNLMMHGIEQPKIDYADTLSKSFSRTEEFDVILANPPFTGSIDRSEIDPNLQVNTSKTELLFIEKALLLLKQNGSAGIIVPQGVLFSGARPYVQIRQKLIEKCSLKAVISLPSGSFRPYAAVATAILLIEKSGPTQKTWFYNVENDGFTADDRRQRISGSQLPDVLSRWNGLDRPEISSKSNVCFFVDADRIRENQYNLAHNRYGVPDQVHMTAEDPHVVLERLEAAEQEIQAGLSALGELFK
jgi:type I restriction enzyme M protein